MIKFLLFLLLSVNSYGYVDFSAQYSYSKQTSLEESNMAGEVVSRTRVLGVNWAWYLFKYTAIELNYSQSTEEFDSDRNIQVDPTILITNVHTEQVTEVRGIGIRQSFASRRARFLPTLSLGYASLKSSGETIYDAEISGTPIKRSDSIEETTSSSSYITLGLRIKITQLVGISLTAKSVMRDLEISEAQNNMTYLAGFSWIF